MSAATIDATSASVIDALGFPKEMAELRERIADWVHRSNRYMQDALDWQFMGGSKYFRPLTIFACYRAMHGPGPIPGHIMNSALVIEFFHNVSLIVDDIVDKSPERRGRATMHTKYGELVALMTSGYIVADGYLELGKDLQAIALFSELLKRLGVAECMQWADRRQVLGVEDWRRIAGEDTGSMFEVCACLGDRSGKLRKFGGLLGLVYHGCDDVGDVRGLPALGGGGKEDLRDGILTLPAAIAIQDPRIGALFTRADPTDADLEQLAAAFMAALPQAERTLDGIVEEAEREARLFAPNPAPLLAIVAQTRRLSSR
ncbi:polyprenyl synthetase family protein [Falsiroseomonas oryzae]|uniref:polyprenyl synthetase family protein n=1 Tax=Falsiroseomonas oryzae TaxID=2766473 RepID=UPI0022EAFE68|nr:polyprenyl synthetase family protein [Roseomonas sp. MO-31]